MPPRLPLATRARVPTFPSTSALSHVLSLVQNGYLDSASKVAISSVRRNGTLAAAAAASIVSAQAGPSTSHERRLPSPQQFRSYSSSAAQTVDDSHHDNHNHGHSATSRNRPASAPRFGNQRPSRRSRQPPQARLPSTAITDDQRFFRCLDPPGEWVDLPNSFHSRLKKGAFQSAAHFVHDFDVNKFEARQIGSVGHLFRIFALWKDTAEDDEWRWLSEKLGDLIAFTAGVEVKQKALSTLINVIRAYSHLSLGEEADAKVCLEQSRLDDLKASFIQPTTHAVAALAYVKLEDWEQANKQVSLAVNRAVGRISSHDRQAMEFPSFDYDLLKEYERIVLDAGRSDDLIELVKFASKQTRHYLINASKDGQQYPATISRVLFDALSRIESPVEWWINEQEHSAFVQSAALGTFLSIALARDRSRLHHLIRLFDTLSENEVRIPAHVAMDICEMVSIESKPDARALYQRIRAMYPEPSHHTLYRALKLASRAGWAEDEEQIWQEINDKHVPSWKDRTVSARTHAHGGRLQNTIASLQSRVGERFEEHVGALQILFTAHINANDGDGAYAVLQKINAIGPLNYTYSALLQLYADQANVNAAVRLFDELLASPLKPDAHAYTALISLFAHRRDPMNADNCFRAMIEAGIEPDHVAYGAIINAEVESGDWLAAAKRWSELPPHMKTHRSIASAVIRALVLLSSPTEHVLALFRQINKPSARTWSLVIQSACDGGDMSLARDLFEEMEHGLRKSNGSTENVVYSMSILLHGYMTHGDGQSARAVYDEMVRREIVPSSVTYGMIIKSFAEARGERSLEQAHDFALTVHKQSKAGFIADRRHQKALTNQNIFSPLLVAHGRSQNWEMAQAYFDMIAEDDSQESVRVYAQLMDVHRRAGDTDKVLEIWNKAFQLSLEVASFRKPTDEVDPTGAEKPTRSNENILCIPLSIALDSLSVAGRYFDVKRIWNDVEAAGFGFDAGNYNHLCVALARTGDVMGAFMVADQILLKRYEEVKQRKNEAIRESANLPSLREINRPNGAVDEGEMEDMISTKEEEGEEGLRMDVVDRPVQPFYGPPNRRHQLYQRSPFTAEAKADPYAQLDLRLLQSWRPSDTLWKPSLLTLSVLDTAYAQLEEASRRRAWVPLTFSDEGEGEGEHDEESTDNDPDFKPNKRSYGVVLPLFGNMPVRNHMTGLPSRKGPKEILMSLNKRYSKVIGLIMFHRKKRLAEKMKQDRMRQKKK